MKILVTAFQPFGGEKINPSLEAMKLLPKEIEGNEIIKLELPVVYYESIDLAFGKILKEKPDAILMLGQAGGRDGLTIERVGINVNDSKAPDNQGLVFIDTAVFSDGKAAYFATLPIKKIVEELRKEKITANVSNSAGTYVCNQLLYGVLYYLEKYNLDIPCGFMHVPYIKEQLKEDTKLPYMELSEIEKGIEIALKTISHD